MRLRYIVVLLLLSVTLQGALSSSSEGRHKDRQERDKKRREALHESRKRKTQVHLEQSRRGNEDSTTKTGADVNGQSQSKAGDSSTANGHTNLNFQHSDREKEEIHKTHQGDTTVDGNGGDDIYHTAADDSEEEDGEETEEEEDDEDEDAEEEAIPTGQKGQHFAANPSYPWNSERYMDHAEALLHDMRTSMVLEVKEESLPRPLMLQQYKQNVLADRKFNRAGKNTHDSPTSTNNGNNDKREDSNSNGKSRDTDGIEAAKDKKEKYVCLRDAYNEVIVCEDEFSQEDMSATKLLHNATILRNLDGWDFYPSVMLPQDFVTKNAQRKRLRKHSNGSKGGRQSAHSRGSSSSSSGSSSSGSSSSISSSSSSGTSAQHTSGHVDHSNQGLAMHRHGVPLEGYEGIFDDMLFDELYEGVCMELPSGYWSYQWCHAQDVQQYHLEHTAKKTTGGRNGKGNTVAIKRVNEMSLGAYGRASSTTTGDENAEDQQDTPRGRQARVLYRESEDGESVIVENVEDASHSDAENGEKGRILKIIDTYEGGKDCDVDGYKVPRRSQVILQCCEVPMSRERSFPLPPNMDGQGHHESWDHIQSLMREANPPEVVNNAADSSLQPLSVRSMSKGHEQRELATVHGHHHPPHHSPQKRLGHLLSQKQEISRRQSVSANQHGHTDTDSGRNDDGKETVSAYNTYPDLWGQISGLMETSICNYQIVVCAPALCSSTDLINADEEENEAYATKHSHVKAATIDLDSKGATTTRTDTQSASSLQDSNNNNDKRNDHRSPNSASSAESSAKLVQLMKGLQGMCLIRQIDWWTYEVCFKTGVRQFHLHPEVRRDKEGNTNGGSGSTTQMVVQSEFDLGRAPLPLYKNEVYLQQLVNQGGQKKNLFPEAPPLNENGKAASSYVQALVNYFMRENSKTPPIGMPSKVLQTGDKPHTLNLHFVEGTVCDIENVRRSTEVEMSCGPADSIMEIVEDRTCHYVFRVTVKALCDYLGFKPVAKRVIPVEMVSGHEYSKYNNYLKDVLGLEDDNNHQPHSPTVMPSVSPSTSSADLQRKKKLDKERRQDLEAMLVDETGQPIKIVDPDEEEELLMTLDAMIKEWDE